MKSARISWDLPTTRSNGEAQDPALLDYVEVGFSADLGQTFTTFGQILASVSPQETVIPDLVDGDYVVRLQVFDVDGLESALVDTAFNIDTSVPGAVTNVVVTLE